MFSVTTLDLVRLDSDHLAQTYTVHARAAERLAQGALVARIAIVSLLGASTASSIATLLAGGRWYAVASVVTTAAALIGFALYATLGLETRVGAHRQLAHRVWIVAQQFRALVEEINDGLVDSGSVRRRRDELVQELHTIYEQGFGADQPAREIARLPPWPADHAA